MLHRRPRSAAQRRQRGHLYSGQVEVSLATGLSQRNARIGFSGVRMVAFNEASGVGDSRSRYGDTDSNRGRRCADPAHGTIIQCVCRRPGRQQGFNAYLAVAHLSDRAEANDAGDRPSNAEAADSSGTLIPTNGWTCEGLLLKGVVTEAQWAGSTRGSSAVTPTGVIERSRIARPASIVRRVSIAPVTMALLQIALAQDDSRTPAARQAKGRSPRFSHPPVASTKCTV
jgi:hypothetical protein